MNFKSGDKVEIINGVYKGYKGTINDYYTPFNSSKKYWVNFGFWKWIFKGKTGKFINEENLKLIK